MTIKKRKFGAPDPYAHNPDEEEWAAEEKKAVLKAEKHGGTPLPFVFAPIVTDVYNKYTRDRKNPIYNPVTTDPDKPEYDRAGRRVFRQHKAATIRTDMVEKIEAEKKIVDDLARRKARRMRLTPAQENRIKRFSDMVADASVSSTTAVTRGQGDDATTTVYPNVPIPFLWPDKKLKRAFPSIAFTDENSVLGAGATEKRCDMCKKLKSDCGQLFQQGLFEMCADCCTSTEQKENMIAGIKVFSPQKQQEITSTSRWELLTFGLGKRRR